MRVAKLKVPVLMALSSIAVGCGLTVPPDPAPETLLGCFAMDSNIPESFADTLGYQLPDHFRLAVTEHGQWSFLPTDEEWAPAWSRYGSMPSDHARRSRLWAAGEGDPETLRRIPGDSIDITFPGPIGGVVIRLGGDPDHLAGRAAYAVRDAPGTNRIPWAEVTAVRTACDGVPLALRRTRYVER